MEVGELISAPSLAAEFAAKCPFKEEESGPAKAAEDIPDDDLDKVQAIQANDGGVLGKNLSAGKPGVADGGPYPANDFLYREAANDSERGRKTLLHIESYRQAKEGDFPFTVAAHHLIPGNASLYKEDVKLVDLMTKGKSVKTIAGSSKTIQFHIGYDVNGSHNGVWLPGNYAIKTALPSRLSKKGKTLPAREGTTPVDDVSWEELSKDYEPWQYAYVAGACKAAHGQFHDTHEEPYSASVRKNLIKIVIALSTHLDGCTDCMPKTEIPPPFRIKHRLYALSSKLRGFVTGPPGAWKRPWFTSERWSQKYFVGGKLSPDFRKAYAAASETNPHLVKGNAG